VPSSINTVQLANGGISQFKVANGYVDLSSAQTVAGIKTFSSAPVLSGASITANTIPGASLVAAGVVQAKVANGYVDLSSVQTVAGVKTFSSAPILSGVAITAGTINAASLVSASITSTQLATGGVLQASVANGYVDLSSAQTVAGIKTFSSAPVLSGASITAATIPAASLVAASIGSAQLASGGVIQGSVANGYVDLSSAQTVGGIKTFSAAPVLSGASITAGTIPGASLATAGVVQASVANGYVDLSSAQTVAGIKTFSSAPVLSGAAITAGTIPAASLVAASIGSAQLAAGGVVQAAVTNGYVDLSSVQTVGGAKTFSAAAGFSSAVTLSGGVILPVTQTALSIVSGVVAVNLNSQSLNKFSLAMSAAITAFTFTNVIVNATFEIYFTNTSGSNKQINKNLSSGAVTCVNSLSGNTLIANSSVWLIRGNVVSSTVVVMEFVNYT
jgi:hypothetical protein